MISQTMRYVAHEPGGGPEVMRIEEMALPSPGPRDVLVRVAFAGVNRPDLHQRAGKYPPPPGASPVLGLEVSGEIVALGREVTEWKTGDEVCALTAGGGYAEYCSVNAAHCLPIPHGLDQAQAAALPENFFTVWTNLIDRGRLKSGESVLIHGGSSGIGYAAIQFAVQWDAQVFTTVGTEEKAAFCRKLGAALAINYRKQDFVQEIKQATHNRGVDVILDMVGGDYVPKNISLLGIEGRLVQIAFLRSSVIPALDLREVMTRRLTITGSTLRPRSVQEKATIAESLKQNVWSLLESGKIKVIIDSVFPIDDVANAHRVMEESKHIGKILLKVS
jgi:NADPH:quinone reductase